MAGFLRFSFICFVYVITYGIILAINCVYKNKL